MRSLAVTHGVGDPARAVGVNRNDINPMRHGETSLFQNCTELFPSPSGETTVSLGICLEMLYPCDKCCTHLRCRSEHRERRAAVP